MAVTGDKEENEGNSVDEKESKYWLSLSKYFNHEEPEWTGSITERNQVPEEKSLKDIKSEIENDMKKDLESWRLDMLHKFEVKKQELATELKNREREFERRMHEKEKSFADKRCEEMPSDKEKKLEVARDLPSKDEPVKVKEDDIQVKDGDVQGSSEDMTEAVRVQDKVRVANQEDLDQQVKQRTGRKPKFKDEDLLQHAHDKMMKYQDMEDDQSTSEEDK